MPGLRQRLHDRSCNEQGHDGDELSDEDRSIQVERRPPLGLAVLDHPGACGLGAHTELGAAVAFCVAAAAPVADDVRGGGDLQPVLLSWLALHPPYVHEIPGLTE